MHITLSRILSFVVVLIQLLVRETQIKIRRAGEHRWAERGGSSLRLKQNSPGDVQRRGTY